MGIINIDKNSIPIKAYLRADSISQHFSFRDEQKELVTETMFWGNNFQEGIYLNYSDINEKSIQIAQGISARDNMQTKKGEECDQWIQKNLYDLESSKLFVVQGYAGCGKTTFVNHLIKSSTTKSYYIDIGKDWSYPQEPYLFFNELLCEFDCLLDEVVSLKKKRDRIWQKFIELGSDVNIRSFDLELPNAFSAFRRIKENSTWKTLRINLHGYLDDTYNQKLLSKSNYSQSESIWYNRGQTQTILSLFILLCGAKNSIENTERPKTNRFSLFFDNLDVITNPSIPAENVILLWGLIHHYIVYRNSCPRAKQKELPIVKIVITVRKVLYSHIISRLPNLEMKSNYDEASVTLCDISHLYKSQEVLNHRIEYWSKNINDEKTISTLKHLKEISLINDNSTNLEEVIDEDDFSISTTLNFDALLNHNYRAFSNVLSDFFDNKYLTDCIISDFKTESTSTEWQKVATLIFSLSFLYRKENIWNHLGFGCSDSTSIDYPTTLNRLILNYLYLSKRGQNLSDFALNRTDFPDDEKVSLKTIIDSFEKVNIIVVDSELNKNQLQKKYSSTDEDMKSVIIERIADMCSRNPMTIHSKAYGYDSGEDELWRRPLYFVGGVILNHTAASKDELEKYFKKCVENNEADKVFFSITDEGFVLIRDIVANFEFYSARYCSNSLIKPLHQAISPEEIDSLIRPVYKAIKKCCSRNIVFMHHYMTNYDIDKNMYLGKYFHPRTKPHFDGDHTKKLSSFSFRPQLHIVRVIYSHVAYFNTVKEYFSKSELNKDNLMCKCLTKWIKEYLDLYQSNFQLILKDTICYSDNNVYKKLFPLVIEQEQQYSPDGDQKNINIGSSIRYF